MADPLAPAPDTLRRYFEPTTEELAVDLAVCTKTLQRWLASGLIPRHLVRVVHNDMTTKGKGRCAVWTPPAVMRARELAARYTNG